MTSCFRCGDDDHLSYDCPQGTREQPAPPPDGPSGAAGAPWCGTCDKQTRLIEYADYMTRCPRCHPKAHATLPQHRRCGGCTQVVYAWDPMPCGHHQALPLAGKR